MAAEYEVIVVGAGPAGASAALQACRQGLGPVLLIDRAHMPRAKPCGSGISPKARKILKSLGLWDEVERLAYPINGLRLVSPSGREVLLTGGESAVVLERAVFDKILVDAAVRAGARFLPGTKVDGPLHARGRVCGVRTRAGEITSRWVIGADGTRGRFNRDPRPRRILHACMAWFEGVPFTPKTVEMIYQPEWTPHYGWLFPESAERVNFGICIEADRLGRRSIREFLRAFLEKFYGRRLAGARQIGGLKSHPISTTLGIQHLAEPGVLLAGEADRLTNVATGEGISYAMASGRLAARAIGLGMDRQATAAWYTNRLRLSFQAAFLVAELYCRLGVRALDYVTRLGNLAGVRRLSSAALSNL